MKSSCLNYIYGVLRTLSFIFVAGVFASLAVHAADIDTGPFELEGNSLQGLTSGYTDTMDNPNLDADDWSTYGPDQGLTCVPAAGAPEVILQVNPPLATCGSASGPGSSDHHPGVDPQGDGHDSGGATRHLFVWDLLLDDNDDQYWRGTKDTDLLEDRQIKLANPTSDKTNLHHTELAFYQNGTQQLFFKSTLLAQNGSAAFGLGLHQDSFSHDGSKFWRLDGDGNLTNVAPELMLGDVEVTMKLENGGGVVFVNAYVYVGESATVITSGPDEDKVQECLDLTINAHPDIKAADNYCELEKSNVPNWAIVATLAEARCDGLNSSDGEPDQFACANVNEVATESADSKGYISKFPDKVPNLDAKGQEIDDLPRHPTYHNGDGLPAGDAFLIGFNDYPKTAVGEGGIDLTRFGLEGCFSTAVFASRSSHEISASSEDMTIGQLDLCSINVTKDADTDISKVTDPVNYTIDIENDGGISLYSNSILDIGINADGSTSSDWDGLGNLITNSMGWSDGWSTTCGSSQGEELAPGDTCTITVRRDVIGTDPNPLINEVTAIYRTGSDGVSGDAVSDEDTHRVDLFDPVVEVVKTEKNSTTVSTDGATVTYVYTITNKSTSTTLLDTEIPDLLLDAGTSVDDDVVGDLTTDAITAGCDRLATNASCSFEVVYTPVDDLGDSINDEKVTNTVDVFYHPENFPNDVDDSDSYTIKLFNPDIAVVKEGDLISKVGDASQGYDLVTYTFKVSNETTAHGDLTAAQIPDMEMQSFSDNKLGDLSTQATAAGCDSLDETVTTVAPCTFSVTARFWKTSDGDPTDIANVIDVMVADADIGNQVDNTVTVVYRSAGFGDFTDQSDTSSHTVELFVPDMTISKFCRESPNDGVTDDGDISATEDAQWVYTITNTSWSNTLTDAEIPNLIRDSASDSFGFPDPGPKDLTSDFPANLAEGVANQVEFVLDYTPSEDDVPSITNTITVNYHPDGFTNDIEREDTHVCPIKALAPARIVIEKVTIGGVGTYKWITGNDPLTSLLDLRLPDAGITRTTVLGALPDSASPFADPATGNGFVTTAPLFDVKAAFNTTRTYTLEEDLVDLGLNEPDQRFVSLTCQEAANSSAPTVGISHPNPHEVSLDVWEGSVVYCRWVNEVQGKIIVDKVTMPAGDLTVFDFSVTGGPSSLSDSPALADATTPYDSGYIIPGSGYTVAEVNYPAGWESKDVTCTGVVPGRGTDDDEDPANINLDPDEIVTCIFTNAKIPLLTLVKEVDNQFSGTKVASNWLLTASGDGGFSGNSGNANAGPILVKADVAYELSENQFEFYEVKTEWSCVGGTNNIVDPDGDPNLAPHPTIELEYGDDVTCTIVNKDIPIEFCPEPGTTGKPLQLIVELQDNSAHSGLDVQQLSHGDVFIDPLALDHPLPAFVDVWIIPLPGGNVVKYFNVTPGGMADLLFANFQSGGVAPKTQFEVYSAVDDDPSGVTGYMDGELIQRVGFHTSCSQILNIGHQYGLIKVTGGILFDGTVVNP